jgi:VanZ family protein
MIRALALGLVALVFWLSLTPKPPSVPGLPSGSDLAVHVLMHCAVAATLMLGWPGAGRIALAYGLAVGLELGQALVPGRTLSGWDMAANLAGAAWGSALATQLAARLPARLR